MMRVNPDDWLWVSWVTTSCRVSAALGATSRMVCISASVPCWSWPINPRSEMIASRAGNRASTA